MERPVPPRLSEGARLFFWFLLSVLSAQAQAPRITWLAPIALQPGPGNRLEISGQNLSDATELWMTFPAPGGCSGRVLSASTTQVVCQVDLPKKTPPGIGALRLVTPQGMTPLELWMVDDLRTSSEGGTNHTLDSAQPIQAPVGLEGHTDELRFDYFRLSATKGQQVAFEVVAQRLGSRLDPVLRIIDARGHELAYCDDDPRVGRDVRLRCTFPASGDYLVEVRDINYGGGPDFRYRLRLGDFPLVALAYPPFRQPHMKGPVTVLGDSEHELGEQAASLADDLVRASVPVRSRRGSSFVSMLAAESPQAVEQEPNDTHETATPLAIPSGISARFQKTNDIDTFRFKAAQGQKLLFRARNRSLGSPCDLFMSIRKADGGALAEFDPTGPDEGSITNTFKEAGEYFLVVEELNQGGGPDLAYHIEGQELLPGFELSVATNDFHGAPGQSITIKVTAERREYEGPITLWLETLPSVGSSRPTQSARSDEPSAASVEIPEKKNEAELKVQIPQSANPGTLVHVRVRGTANVGERDVSATANTVAALRKLWPNLPQPPAELASLVAIGIRAPK